MADGKQSKEQEEKDKAQRERLSEAPGFEVVEQDEVDTDTEDE